MIIQAIATGNNGRKFGMRDENCLTTYMYVRKGEVQEEDICMKFLTSFSLMKKEVSEDPFILLLAKVVEVLCILIVLI
ncbi:unnamed protein product [Trifolium pratense]|uniref:Uncharacterized protein n=1 Tax=Trifolium pratense TaxID=57577 RepID=A0ACB0KFB8_TRIPR|nr:unnamed protein product [Trifolium pratense]